MSNEVRVEVDWSKIPREIKTKALTAQTTLDLAIINDTDQFVPMRQGILAKSVISASKIGSGRIVYDTPYARHLYYGINVRTGRTFNISKLKHPKATAGWFDVAKAAYLEKWIRQVEEVMKK